MRLARVLAFLLVGLTVPALASAPAEAADLRSHPSTGTLTTAPPPARTPSVLRGGDPGLSVDRHRHRDDGRRHGEGRGHHRSGHHRPVIVAPQTVFVTPGRCFQAGYWTYQWVPQYYTYTTWVAGQWSPDGRWIEGHYAPTQYASGYYQPLWVEGYYTAC
jgi:hypothetical protein